jgi:hypothetical protein
MEAGLSALLCRQDFFREMARGKSDRRQRQRDEAVGFVDKNPKKLIAEQGSPPPVIHRHTEKIMPADAGSSPISLRASLDILERLDKIAVAIERPRSLGLSARPAGYLAD